MRHVWPDEGSGIADIQGKQDLRLWLSHPDKGHLQQIQLTSYFVLKNWKLSPKDQEQGCLLLLLLFNFGLEILARAIRWEKHKRHLDLNGRIKAISICGWYKLVYGIPKESSEKLLELINIEQGYRIQYQYANISCVPRHLQWTIKKWNQESNLIHNNIKKNKILRGKFNLKNAKVTFWKLQNTVGSN